MGLISIILFICFPIICTPIFVFLYFKDSKHRLIYSILLGIIFGIINYHYLPPSDYDLYRHHLNIIQYMKMSFETYTQTIFTESEPINFSIKYFVSLTQDVNLLQFFVTSFSFTIFFGIIGDYAKRIKLNIKYFILVLLFTFTSINLLYMFSGLFNQFAILVFALGYYLLKIEKGSKFINYLILISSILIHSSMIFPIVIFVLFKIFKEKISIGLIFTIIILFLFPSTLLIFINKISDITIFSQIQTMYNSYFLQNKVFYAFYGGNILIMELAKVFFYFLIYYLYGKNKDTNHKFCLILLISILLLIINSIVFVRFIFLLQILGSLFLMDYFKNKKPNTIATYYMIICITIFTIFQLYQFRGMDFGEFFNQDLFKNLFLILKT